MNTRSARRLNSWLQLVLVALIIILVNLWASDHFLRVDVTDNKNYTLDLKTRSLVWNLERPLVAKVYFTEGLQAPYNNHRTILIDQLEELRAYAKGWLKLEVVDPTNIRELEAEARSFGILPVDYRFQTHHTAELKKVYMGVAFVYGDRQETLPAITHIQTLEYDLARALRSLLEDVERPILALTTGHGEPDIIGGGGPLQSLSTRIQESYEIKLIDLGKGEPIPEDTDALWIIGPQKSFSEEALFQVDQYMMRGGALGVFVTNTKPDMRSLRAQSVYHGLDGLLGHYGIRLNRDLVVDRKQNGVMNFPVRQGNTVRSVQINYPLIPTTALLQKDALVMRGIDLLTLPFISSIDLMDLPVGVEAQVWAKTSSQSGRIKGVMTIDPKAYRLRAPTEETGQWPVLVSLNGSWSSYFSDRDVPQNGPFGVRPVIKAGAPARLVVSGSADMVANNIGLMLNIADWMMQDESLIAIRSKVARIISFPPQELATEQRIKLINLLGGSSILFCFGLLLRLVQSRRRSRSAA
ncbi:MAG: GldG family protein [Myxococcota bacterium]